MDAEPNGPSPLPQPQGDEPWLDRVLLWRERVVGQHNSATIKIMALLGVLAALGIGFLWVGSARRGPPVETLLPRVDPAAVAPASQASTPDTDPGIIVVHVAGAVTRPGLVELTPPARVADAVEAAGGATATGDLDRLNLATLLRDEDRVVVPEQGQPIPELAPGATEGTAETAGPLDLNRASAEQLEQLPGIGPATAAAIVAHRAENGPFQSVTALDNVSGIGPAKLALLRDLVLVEP